MDAPQGGICYRRRGSRKTAFHLSSDSPPGGKNELSQCMIRRVNAREKFGMKEGLRQCIRPVGGEKSPGLDEIRRVPVLRKRTAS
jgi:hypothetical protein